MSSSGGWTFTGKTTGGFLLTVERLRLFERADEGVEGESATGLETATTTGGGGGTTRDARRDGAFGRPGTDAVGDVAMAAADFCAADVDGCVTGIGGFGVLEIAFAGTASDLPAPSGAFPSRVAPPPRPRPPLPRPPPLPLVPPLLRPLKAAPGSPILPHRDSELAEGPEPLAGGR